MKKIRITKCFSFEMAHALINYDGPCKNIHGHSYKLIVTLIGDVKNKKGDPEDGLVIDFKDLKEIVNKYIIDKYDHAVVLPTGYSSELTSALASTFDNVIYTEWQPSAENLIIEYAKVIKEHLPSHVLLHNLRLYETANSYCEWFADDNK